MLLVLFVIILFVVPSFTSSSVQAVSFSDRSSIGVLGASIYQPGACNYVGIRAIISPRGTYDTHYYTCGPAGPVVSSQIGASSGKATFLGGNQNDLIGWSSGPCETVDTPQCTDTLTDITSNMVPNTNSWSIQDNAFHNYGFPCYSHMNYQDVMEIGSSSNGYANVFGIELFGAVGWFCNYQSSPPALIIPILTGMNLNTAGNEFEQWFTLTNNYPTTAWLTIYASNGIIYTYSSPMPNGNPDVSITGWELNVVCGSYSCYTTFSGGAGTIDYYQVNVNAGGIVVGTGENSNCQYSGPAWSGDVAWQSFSC